MKTQALRICSALILTGIFLFNIGEDKNSRPQLESSNGVHATSSAAVKTNIENQSKAGEHLYADIARKAIIGFSNVHDLSDHEKLVAAREAIFAYSRQPNDNNTLSILRDARNAKIISENELYGEFAHTLSDNVEDPVSIVKEISESGNFYGIEVMFSTLENAPWAELATKKQRAAIFDVLQDLKPPFNSSIPTMGVADIMRYESWLASSRKFYGKEDFSDYLENLIFVKAVEPREYFAIIDGGFYKELVFAGREKSIKRINTVVDSYIQGYPENMLAATIAQKRD